MENLQEKAIKLNLIYFVCGKMMDSPHFSHANKVNSEGDNLRRGKCLRTLFRGVSACLPVIFCNISRNIKLFVMMTMQSCKIQFPQREYSQPIGTSRPIEKILIGAQLTGLCSPLQSKTHTWL